MRTLLVALLLLAPLALADPNEDPLCRGGEAPQEMGLGVVQVGIGAEATWYLDDRGALHHGWAFYQESNGVFDAQARPLDNLQRGGVSEIVTHHEACYDANPAGPDYFIL